MRDGPRRYHICLGEYACALLTESVNLLRLYDCLCDETRLRLLGLLAVRPMCVCHFEAVLKLPQAKISRHLATLRRHGLVTTEQRGPWRIYSLARPTPPALAANLACLQDAAGEQPVFHRDRERLSRLAAETDCGCTTPEVPRRRLIRLAR
jgi:ArsR family transcriptional regulator